MLLNDRIHIQMMDNFSIYINESRQDQALSKSRKGVALIAYLILNEGNPVPNQRLLTALWPEENSSNPGNSLKTLISRMRSILNQISDGLGSCIVSDRGTYCWEMQPGITVDVYEIEEICRQLQNESLDSGEVCRLSQQMMKLYRGDLLQNSDVQNWIGAHAMSLRNKYMAAVYHYVELLQQAENYDEVINVCRTALEIDSFDDHLNMELMSALMKLNRTNDALNQYKQVMHMYYRYLGVQPSEEMREFYKQIVNAGKTLEFNLESIRNELQDSNDQRGAFICEYVVFKELYNLQIRNFERIGATMFLAVIMVSDMNGEAMEAMKQERIMSGLMEIIKNNLRKGDTITHFSPTILALLLPTVNYVSVNMVMERIKRLFYQKYPSTEVKFSYSVGPLCNEMESAAQ